ncbi:unnamed protein product, partial [Ixodes pacificus]
MNCSRSTPVESVYVSVLELGEEPSRLPWELLPPFVRTEVPSPRGREGKGRTCTESIWGLGAAGLTSPGKSRGGEASSRTAWLRTSTLSR